MKINFNKKVFIVGGVILMIVAIALGWYLYQKKNNQIAIIDDLPIWELNNGTTVYREMEFDGKKLTVSIVVQGPEDMVEGTKIYEVIPKEIAASAKDLKFNVEPEVVEDDPVVLWSTCKTNCPKDQGVLDITATLAKGLITTIRDAGLNYFSDTCATQTAKKWIKDAGYKQGEFFGCSQYIRYMEKEVAMRQTAEWQNKLEQGKIKNTYEPAVSQYQIHQQTAKKVINEQKKTQQQTQTQTQPKNKSQQTTTPTKKSNSCDYCGTIKNSNSKTGFYVCRSDKTGCTSCNTDADCLDTHQCVDGVLCNLKESEIHKKNK